MKKNQDNAVLKYLRCMPLSMVSYHESVNINKEINIVVIVFIK